MGTTVEGESDRDRLDRTTSADEVHGDADESAAIVRMPHGVVTFEDLSIDAMMASFDETEMEEEGRDA